MKSKQLKRLWSLALLLVLMCLPEMAWAQTWSIVGEKDGSCIPNSNYEISFNNLNNSCTTTHSHITQSGNAFEIPGHVLTEGKHIVHAILSLDMDVPSYTKKKVDIDYKFQLTGIGVHHGCGLNYFGESLSAAQTSNVIADTYVYYGGAAGYQDGNRNNFSTSNYSCLSGYYVFTGDASVNHDVTSETFRQSHTFDCSTTSSEEPKKCYFLFNQSNSTGQAGPNCNAKLIISNVAVTTTYYANITFNANGGSGTMSNQAIEGSGTLTTNAFTRENYVFAGWNTAADGSGTAYADAASFVATDTNKGPVTLYAQWTPTATITFDAHGGSGTMAQQQITGSGTLTANAFTRTNFVFTGWNTKADGSGTKYANKATFAATDSNNGPITLYAQWMGTATITFDANGGSGTMAIQMITGSGTLTANAFTRDGYSFAKWNTKADGTGSSYADRATFTAAYENKGPITLYAQWTPTATITFDANGGSGTMAQQTITGSGILSANAFTCTDKLFAAWNTAADGSGTTYANKATFTASNTNNGPITLYAQWEPAVTTITFDANGGSGTMAQQMINGSGTLFANAFIRDGYTFAKWNTKANGTGTSYDDAATFTVNEENKYTITLYAQWTPTATITFDANGGSGTMAQQTITGSGTLIANTFTRSNYRFNGWNTAVDGSGTAYAAGAIFTATNTNNGPITLYAQWEEKPVPVYKDDGTTVDYYEIRNAIQFKTFADMVNDGQININAKLTKDIDMSALCHAASEGVALVNWTPIGNENNSYSGTFDGDGHTISNLYFNNTGTDHVGLFGCTSGATIKNVGVLNVYFNGNSHIGGVCGYNYNNSSITNCYTTGTVSGNSSSVGGVCGKNDKSSITNCYATGDVSGYKFIGGVCGYNYNNSNITKCYATGKVSGTNNYIGGLCGYNHDSSSITNCYATGTVSGSWFVGGVCGYNNKNSSITNCYATGKVSGSERVGGVCGMNYNSSSITYCYSRQNGAVGANNAITSYVSSNVPLSRFQSGEIAYLLNGSRLEGTEQSPLVWGQNLETQSTPVLSGENVRYARNMANQWGTIVLPYDVSYDQNNGKYKLYKLSAADAQKLTFTEYENGTISAGTPMAVKKIAGDGIDIAPASTPNFNTSITPVSEVANWTMKGTYTQLTDQTGMYFIAQDQFWKADAAITINPFRAWFEGTLSSSVKALNIVIEDEDETTSIQNSEFRIHNSGKYLENGRVVIVKNGKKYNVNGQALR